MSGKGPVITTQTAIPQSQPRRVRPELEIFDDSIEAKPLGGTPLESIKLKNTGVELRGVNYTSGNGLRLRQALSLGWVPATEADVDAPGWLWKDGAFKLGDLILMKNDRRAVLGQRKYNAQRAMALGGRPQQFARGQAALSQELAGISAPSESKSKMSVFVPGQKEIEGLMGKD